MLADESRIADLLCTAFEGGSYGVGYWGRIVEHIEPEVVWRGKRWEDHVYPYVHYPLSEGGAVVLRDAELPDDDEDAVEAMRQSIEEETWVLNRAALQRGLDLFPIHSPTHFGRWLDENEDAETGEIFVQLCVLGKIVYG